MSRFNKHTREVMPGSVRSDIHSVLQRGYRQECEHLESFQTKSEMPELAEEEKEGRVFLDICDLPTYRHSGVSFIVS